MDKHISVMNDLHKINISTVVTANAPAERHLVQDISAAPPQPQPAPVVIPKQLSEAMTRRIADFRLSRRDLAVRVAEADAALEHDELEVRRKLEEIVPIREQLAAIAAELNGEAPLSELDCANQTLVAAESRKLEEMRLQAIRLIASGGAPAARNPVQQQVQPSSSSIDWDSITFGQFVRCGWGLFFPVIAAVVLSALIIGAAVIAAFNGSIRW